MIAFFDYDAEWLIAPLIAKENGENNPILVCSVPDDEGLYGILPEENRLTNIPWYKTYTDRLKLIKSFTHYFIYEITDLQAYHGIWLRLSSDHSISNYVFSSNCDLNRLEALLTKKTFLDLQDLKSIAKWGYWQQFGGGADEHFAYYISEDPEQMTKFSLYLTKERYKKRYQNISLVELREEETTSMMTWLSKKHGYFFVLFKESKNAMTKIKTKEAHKVWWVNYFERKESEYEDEDYDIFLSYKKEVDASLQQIRSIKPREVFAHNEYLYKVILLDDWKHMQTLWNNSDLADFIEAVFSVDTDLESLKQLIIKEKKYTQPECMTKLGSWVISRARDGSYSHKSSIFYTEKKDHLIGYIKDRAGTYECYPVNKQARHY